jgi:hypothetical protein
MLTDSKRSSTSISPDSRKPHGRRPEPDASGEADREGEGEVDHLHDVDGECGAAQRERPRAEQRRGEHVAQPEQREGDRGRDQVAADEPRGEACWEARRQRADVDRGEHGDERPHSEGQRRDVEQKELVELQREAREDRVVEQIADAAEPDKAAGERAAPSGAHGERGDGEGDEQHHEVRAERVPGEAWRIAEHGRRDEHDDPADGDDAEQRGGEREGDGGRAIGSDLMRWSPRLGRREGPGAGVTEGADHGAIRLGTPAGCRRPGPVHRQAKDDARERDILPTAAGRTPDIAPALSTLTLPRYITEHDLSQR